MSKGVAWYDVKGHGWLRDLWIILHPPYTLWHLSYVPIGAALAPRMNWAVLGWTVLAFFLGMGIAGHCLDELNGRPLKTTIPATVLWPLAILSLAGAISIGVIVGVHQTLGVIPCMVFGGFIVFAYNMELGKGFFHRDEWFGIAWGAFPAITAYIAQTRTISMEAVLVAGFALAYSMAQRKLSMQSRFWRRKVFSVGGWYLLNMAPAVPAATQELKRSDIIGPVDLALQYLNLAIVFLAIGLLTMRIW